MSLLHNFKSFLSRMASAAEWSRSLAYVYFLPLIPQHIAIWFRHLGKFFHTYWSTVKSGMAIGSYGDLIIYPSFSVNVKLFLPNSLSDNCSVDEKCFRHNSKPVLRFTDFTKMLRYILFRMETTTNSIFDSILFYFIVKLITVAMQTE